MNETLEKATESTLRHFGDSAVQEYYRRLREHVFSSTHCDRCHQTAFPPRPFCPTCGGAEVRWVELPRRGTLHAFTQQQERSIRFGPPDVIGLVELEGVGRVLSRIDAPLSSLAIGMEVDLDFVDIGGGWVLHQFRPPERATKAR